MTDGESERLAAWQREHELLLRALSDPEVLSDRQRLAETSRRAKELDSLISTSKKLEEARAICKLRAR